MDESGFSMGNIKTVLPELLRQQPGNPAITIPKGEYNPDGDPDDDDVLVEYLAGMSYIRVAFRHDDRDCYIAAVSLKGDEEVILRIYDDDGREFVDGVPIHSLIDTEDMETLVDFVRRFAAFDPEEFRDMEIHDVHDLIDTDLDIDRVIRDAVRQYAERRYVNKEDTVAAIRDLSAILTGHVKRLIRNTLTKDSF